LRRATPGNSRRVGEGDVEALALTVGLAEEIDTATAEAVKRLRDRGYSWAEIGSGWASLARPHNNAGDIILICPESHGQ